MKNHILLIIFAIFAGSSLAAQEKPNIVLLYIDDWAWNGTSIPMDDSMANSFIPILQMPNLEKLARQGMKFTNAYGSPQCAPARVSVQTWPILCPQRVHSRAGRNERRLLRHPQKIPKPPCRSQRL